MAITADLKILVVDDSKEAQALMKLLLRKKGFTNIKCLDDGLSAFEELDDAVVDNDKYDLIMLDWHMPELDGLEFVKRLKGNKSLKGTPLIMVTAVADEEMVYNAIEQGVKSYLLKPFSGEDLYAKISDLFS